MSDTKVVKMNVASTDPKSLGDIEINCASQLMENMEAAVAADPGSGVAVGQDSNGDPMVFSISSKGGKYSQNLYLTRRKAGTASGWEMVDLTTALASKFGDGLVADSLALTQYTSGEITLAVAGMLNNTPRLFVTDQLPDTAGSTLWDDLGQHWFDRPVSGVKISKVTEITLGNGASQLTSDGENFSNAPLMFVAAETGARETYFVVSADTTKASGNWSEVTPPDGATKVHQMLPALTVMAGAGTFALYEHGQGIELGFQGAPGSNPYGVSQKFTMLVPGGTSVMATTPGDGMTDAVYITGKEGLAFFSPDVVGGNATSTPIATAEHLTGLKGLIAREDDADNGMVAIWAIDETNNLVYLHGKKNDPTAWSHPLTLGTNIAQIAPLRNRRRNTNALVIVDLEGHMSYMWQDPDTTLWKQAEIPLFSNGDVIKFSSYTTRLHFAESTSGNILTGEVEVSASQWCYVTINGDGHVLDPKTPTQVKLDDDGSITITDKVESLSTPVYQIKSSLFKGMVQVHPATNVLDKLSKIKTGDDLKNAKDPKGSPVFTGKQHISYDHGAQAMQQIVALHGTLQASRDPSQSGGAASASVRHTAGVSTGNKLRPAALAANHTWGFSGTDHGSQTHSGENAIEKLGDLFHKVGHEIEHEAGNALRHLEHAFEDSPIGHMFIQVAKGVAKVFINIGEGIISFVVKTAEHIYKLASYVLKKIGAGLEALVKWLGSLFHWDAVLNTHTVLVSIFNGVLNESRQSIDQVRQQVHSKAEEAKATLAGLKPISGPVGSQTSGQIRKNNPDHAHSHTPQSHWGSSHFRHGLRHSKKQGVSTVMDTAGVKGNAENVMSDVAEMIVGEVKSVGSMIDTVATDLVAAFKQGGLSPNQVLEQVGLDILIGLIDMGEKFAEGSLKVTEDVIALIQSLINARINIPVLTWTYEHIIAPGSQFTLLDALMLISSIPTTLIMTIAHGEAPFNKAEAAASQKGSTIEEVLHEIVHAQSVGAAKAIDEPFLRLMQAKSIASGVMTSLFGTTRALPPGLPKYVVPSIALVRILLLFPVSAFQSGGGRYMDPNKVVRKNTVKIDSHRQFLWTMGSLQVVLSFIFAKMKGDESGDEMARVGDGVLQCVFNISRLALYIQLCVWASEQVGTGDKEGAEDHDKSYEGDIPIRTVQNIFWAVSGITLGAGKLAKNPILMAVSIGTGVGCGGIGIIRAAGANTEDES